MAIGKNRHDRLVAAAARLCLRAGHPRVAPGLLALPPLAALLFSQPLAMRGDTTTYLHSGLQWAVPHYPPGYPLFLRELMPLVSAVLPVDPWRAAMAVSMALWWAALLYTAALFRTQTARGAFALAMFAMPELPFVVNGLYSESLAVPLLAFNMAAAMHATRATTGRMLARHAWVAGVAAGLGWLVRYSGILYVALLPLAVILARGAQSMRRAVLFALAGSVGAAVLLNAAVWHYAKARYDVRDDNTFGHAALALWDGILRDRSLDWYSTREDRRRRALAECGDSFCEYMIDGCLVSGAYERDGIHACFFERGPAATARLPASTVERHINGLTGVFWRAMPVELGLWALGTGMTLLANPFGVSHYLDRARVVRDNPAWAPVRDRLEPLIPLEDWVGQVAYVYTSACVPWDKPVLLWGFAVFWRSPLRRRFFTGSPPATLWDRARRFAAVRPVTVVTTALTLAYVAVNMGMNVALDRYTLPIQLAALFAAVEACLHGWEGDAPALVLPAWVPPAGLSDFSGPAPSSVAGPVAGPVAGSADRPADAPQALGGAGGIAHQPDL